MTWTPDTPPPCPLCGTRLVERTEPDGGEEGGMLYAYLCPVCRWEDAGSYDYQRLTVATAPWTRDLWAEVERTREERDSARRDLARIVQLCGWDCDGNDPESPTGAIHLYGDGLRAVRELRQEHAEDLAQVEAERDILAARGGRRPLLVWDTLLKGFQLSPADRTTGSLYTVTSDECAFYGAGASKAGVSSGAVWTRACASMGEALRVAVEHAWDHGYEIAPLWNDTEALREKCDTLAARVRELEAPGECQSVHKLRAALAEVLDHFTQAGHPGRDCLGTGWVPVEQVEQWRSLLSPSWREGQGRNDGEE